MIFVWGKLKPGVTVDRARAEMKGIAARLEKTYPDTNGKSLRGRHAVTGKFGGQISGLISRLLLGAVGLVLAHRLREPGELVLPRAALLVRVSLRFTLQSALLAGKIIRKLLTESFLIALTREELSDFLLLFGFAIR